MPEPERKTWWARNWLWVVIPLAVLSAIATMVGLAVLIIGFVFGLLKSSAPYVEAMARVRSSPAAIAALGAPLKEGWFIQGEVSFENQSGKADLSIPLTGPKGGGTISVVGTKSGGVWTYSKFVLKLDKTNQTVDLAAPSQ